MLLAYCVKQKKIYIKLIGRKRKTSRPIHPWVHVSSQSFFSICFPENHTFYSLYVTLDHKTSLKSLGYICSKGQKYIVWDKIIDFYFMPKIIRISKIMIHEDEYIYYRKYI